MNKENIIEKIEFTADAAHTYPLTLPDDPDYEYDKSPKRGMHGKFGDTYPLTWSDDDEIYTSAGDPNWGKKNDGLDVEKFSGMPLRYKISKLNEMFDYKGWGGDGAKPSGMISVKGVLYFALDNLKGKKPPVYGSFSQHASDATILMSKDKGKTWTPEYKEINIMFPGWKFGSLAFINFGKDNANARDGYVYAVSGDQWDNGSDLRLGRVPNDKIMQREAWEFVSAVEGENKVKWDKDLEKAVSILHSDRKISQPEMVYIAPLKRYLFLTWSLHGDFSYKDGSALYIYEAPEPWGPFTLVHYNRTWEDVYNDYRVNPYCPRIPLKWMAKDGLSGWLQFSGNWMSNDHYLSHIRPFKIILK